jgi:hypothetical protein
MTSFSQVADLLSNPKFSDPSEEGQLQGEPLSEPIYWEGRQWAVTSAGIEKRDGTYFVDAARLWEEENVHGWVMHMSEKNWIDLQDFVNALILARIIHKAKFPSL